MNAQTVVVIKDRAASVSRDRSRSRSRSRKMPRSENRQAVLLRDSSAGGGSASAHQSAVQPSRAMDTAHPAPLTPTLRVPVPEQIAESWSAKPEAVPFQAGHAPYGLKRLPTSAAGNGEARAASPPASGCAGHSAPMEVGEPIVAVLGIASGDGYKNRVALRNIVVMAARVCLKLMVSSNKRSLPP